MKTKVSKTIEKVSRTKTFVKMKSSKRKPGSKDAVKVEKSPRPKKRQKVKNEKKPKSKSKPKRKPPASVGGAKKKIKTEGS